MQEPQRILLRNAKQRDILIECVRVAMNGVSVQERTVQTVILGREIVDLSSAIFIEDLEKTTKSDE